MPLTCEPAGCWILLVDGCDGELEDLHWPVTERGSLPTIEAVRWHLFAHNPMSPPPRPELWGPCWRLVCRCCGLAVGDGEHFADAEHAWEAAEGDGWLRDVCPFCQPSPHPAV